MKGSLTIDQIELLLADNRYDVLFPLIDQGHSLERFQYEHNPGEHWETLLFLCMFRGDFTVFRRILQKHGASILEKVVMHTGEGDETGWYAMVRLFEEASRADDLERYPVLFEIALDTDEVEDTDVIEYDSDRVGWILWKWDMSKEAKAKMVSAAVWCCRFAGVSRPILPKEYLFFGVYKWPLGPLNDVMERVGRILQTQSTWDFEPQIKRGRFLV
jgi:hypothetical protein